MPDSSDVGINFFFNRVVVHNLKDLLEIFRHGLRDEKEIEMLTEAKAKDEIGELTAAAQVMVGHLHDTRQQLEKYAENLEVMVAQRTEALQTATRGILELNREMEALVMERTMSEMALGMADGIRNPLHVIGGFSHRLLKKTDPDDPTRAWVEAIAGEAKRLEEVVERFEALAQKKETFFTQQDLNNIIKDTLDMLQIELENRQIHLVTELSPNPIVGRLNKHLLKIALSHLLRNAIEATPPRGVIRVATSVERNFAVMVIQDTGRGMPAEVVEKVFMPFYTTKIGGTGLGMVFVRQIVDEHRGVIALDSTEGRGTTVTIRLPLRLAERPEVTEKPSFPTIPGSAIEPE